MTKLHVRRLVCGRNFRQMAYSDSVEGTDYVGCIVIPAVTIRFPAIAATMVFSFTVHIYAYSLFYNSGDIFF